MARGWSGEPGGAAGLGLAPGDTGIHLPPLQRQTGHPRHRADALDPRATGTVGRERCCLASRARGGVLGKDALLWVQPVGPLGAGTGLGLSSIPCLGSSLCSRAGTEDGLGNAG